MGAANSDLCSKPGCGLRFKKIVDVATVRNGYSHDKYGLFCEKHAKQEFQKAQHNLRIIVADLI